jgi:hypothetical protein
MTYRGRVQNGVIVLDPSVSLPEGAEVEVQPLQAETSPPTWAEVLKDIVGKAEGLPSDMARNHDHYLHRAPKR